MQCTMNGHCILFQIICCLVVFSSQVLATEQTLFQTNKLIESLRVFKCPYVPRNNSSVRSLFYTLPSVREEKEWSLFLNSRDSTLGSSPTCWHVMDWIPTETALWLVKLRSRKALMSIENQSSVQVRYLDPSRMIALVQVPLKQARWLDLQMGPLSHFIAGREWISHHSQTFYGNDGTHKVLTEHIEHPLTKDVDWMANVVNLTVFEMHLRRLTGLEPLPFKFNGVILKTRYTLATSQHELARDYLIESLKAMPLITKVEARPFNLYSDEQGWNVIAERKGSRFPDEIVIIGAHFDSTSEKPLHRAPGAVDNGSGAAALLTLAHAFFYGLEDQDWMPERTVQFVFFAGEEQGLIGSQHFVRHLNTDGSIKVVAAIIMDMIGYSRRYVGLTVEGTVDFKPLMRLLMDHAVRLTPMFKVQGKTKSFGSDHVSFQRAGIPAVLAIQMDDTDDPEYHRSTDIFSAKRIHLPQCMAIMKAIASTLIHLLLQGL